MFKRLDPPSGDTVTIHIDDHPVSVPAGETVAAALLSAGASNGMDHTRTSAESGRPRAPFCMMGVCFDCLIEIYGRPNRQACLVRVADGMRIRRQRGVS